MENSSKVELQISNHSDSVPKRMEYFKRRIYEELGVTIEENNILLSNNHGHSFSTQIFSPDNDGNIKILFYTIDRKIIEYEHPKATPEKPNIYNERTQAYHITRLNPDNVRNDSKYLIPKGAGTYPFFPPGITQKFEQKVKIKTLILTEGVFKAFKGAKHGLDIVGLTSITHYRDKRNKELHEDIIKLIKICQVENIIMLYDGDCLKLSEKALKNEEDLYKRPAGFFSSACNLNELFKDYNVSFYFAHILSDSISNNPKGLDDLLILFKGNETEVFNDLLTFSKPERYFFKLNITNSQKKLQKYFNLNSPESFYSYHMELIQNKEFFYLGTKFKYNDIEEKLEIVLPAEAQNYFRVGNNYYESFLKPNKHGQLDMVIEPRLKSVIIEDHGRGFIKHIKKYKTFVNIPDHVNYQQVIQNCYNSYSPFTHTPEPGNCEVTLGFIKHIFEEHYELGLDYVQLLYQKPTQKLPILSLVSTENKTGKSTFAIWLRAIFINNFSIIGNSEIASDFNSHIASKLGIAIDESFIDKAAIVEKIKFLSTAEVLPMNRKGKDIVEVDSFLKIILISNKVDKFITATKDDERYWVRKIKKPDNGKPNIIDDLIQEIPAFLYYLDNRKLSTKNEDRAWFRFDLIVTDAFLDIVNASKPKVVREIERQVKAMLSDFQLPELYLSVEDVKELFFSKNFKVDTDYIVSCIREYFPRVKKFKNPDGKEVTKRYKIPYWTEGIDDNFKMEFKNMIGRPYVFKAKDFLPDEDIRSLLDHDSLPF